MQNILDKFKITDDDKRVIGAEYATIKKIIIAPDYNSELKNFLATQKIYNSFRNILNKATLYAFNATASKEYDFDKKKSLLVIANAVQHYITHVLTEEYIINYASNNFIQSFEELCFQHSDFEGFSHDYCSVFGNMLNYEERQVMHQTLTNAEKIEYMKEFKKM